jgi:cytochrome P450
VTGELLLRLPKGSRQALAAALKRLPAPDAKLLAFVLSPAVRADPWHLYRQVQQSRPVHRSGLGAWTIARHRDVATLVRHPQVSVDETHATVALDYPRHGPFTTLFDRTLLFRDPPDHDRIRRLVARAFSPRRIEELRPRIEHLVSRRLDSLAPHGQADLLAELAYPLPVDVICELLGVPEADRDRFPGWSRALAARLDVQPLRNPRVNQQGDAAVMEPPTSRASSPTRIGGSQAGSSTGLSKPRRRATGSATKK